MAIGLIGTMANLYDDPSHTGRKRMWSPTLEELQAITHTGQLRTVAANLGLSVRDGKGRQGNLRTKASIIEEYKQRYAGIREQVEELFAIKSIVEFRKRAVKLGLALRHSRKRMRSKTEITKDYERKLIAGGQVPHMRSEQEHTGDDGLAVSESPLTDTASSMKHMRSEQEHTGMRSEQEHTGDDGLAVSESPLTDTASSMKHMRSEQEHTGDDTLAVSESPLADTASSMKHSCELCEDTAVADQQTSCSLASDDMAAKHAIQSSLVRYGFKPSLMTMKKHRKHCLCNAVKNKINVMSKAEVRTLARELGVQTHHVVHMPTSSKRRKCIYRRTTQLADDCRRIISEWDADVLVAFLDKKKTTDGIALLKELDMITNIMTFRNRIEELNIAGLDTRKHRADWGGLREWRARADIMSDLRRHFNV